VDALGDDPDNAIGLESRAKVEARLRQLEGKSFQFTTPEKGAGPQKISMDVDTKQFSEADDMQKKKENGKDSSSKKKKKRSRDDSDSESEEKKEKKKKKKEKKEKKDKKRKSKG